MTSCHSVARFAVVLALVVALLGCSVYVLPTAHPCVLVEQRDDGYAQLPEDDPRYAALEAYLAEDEPLARLLNVYERTMAAFSASGLRPAAARAADNRAVLVLGQQAGLVTDICVQGLYDQVCLELALGVPITDPAMLAPAAPQLARAVGQALLVLAGQGYGPSPCSEPACDGLPSPPGSVLTQGLGIALETIYCQDLEAGSPPGLAAAGACAHLIKGEGYRDTEMSPADVVQSPGVAGTVFYQLLSEAPTGYPQRFMLWFANYDPQDEALAKIVLVARRLGRRATIVDFLGAYGTTFPGERALARELLAALPSMTEVP